MGFSTVYLLCWMLAKREYFCHVGFCSQLAVCESVEEFSVCCQSSNEEAFKEFSECVIEVYASVGCWVCFVLAVSFVDRLKEIKLPVCELRVRVPQTVEKNENEGLEMSVAGL